MCGGFDLAFVPVDIVTTQSLLIEVLLDERSVIADLLLERSEVEV